MWPCGIDFILSFDTCLRELKVLFFDIWKWSENVLLDHGHNVIEVWNDETDDGLLVLQVLLDLINGIESLGLALNILGLILVIVVLLANEQLLLETLLSLFLWLASGTTNLVSTTWSLVLRDSSSLSLASLFVLTSAVLFHFES